MLGACTVVEIRREAAAAHSYAAADIAGTVISLADSSRGITASSYSYMQGGYRVSASAEGGPFRTAQA